MITAATPNYWTEFEYNKLKLLKHREKVRSISEVYEGIKTYDNLPPISVELQLTNACNLNCPWCTDKASHSNGKSLSKETVFSLLDEFSRMQVGVTLEGGGEPTIHKDFFDIVRYAEKRHVHLGLISNGTIDISDVINAFRWVRISLDSSTPDEYFIEKGGQKFDEVLANLEKYKALRDPEKCYLGIGYVLTTRNHSELGKITKRLNDCGVDYIYFRPVEEAPDITPSRDELYDIRKYLLTLTDEMRLRFMMTINDRLIKDNASLPCVAHSLTSIIHGDGTVALCEKRRHDPIVLGNVNENSFEEIWNSDYRRQITRKILDSEEHRGCEVCRITSFNKIFSDLESMNTDEFI